MCLCACVCVYVCVYPDVNTAQPLCAQSVSSAHLLPLPCSPPGMLKYVFSLASSIKDENIWGLRSEKAERQLGFFFFLSPLVLVISLEFLSLLIFEKPQTS